MTSSVVQSKNLDLHAVLIGMVHRNQMQSQYLTRGAKSIGVVYFVIYNDKHCKYCCFHQS